MRMRAITCKVTKFFAYVQILLTRRVRRRLNRQVRNATSTRLFHLTLMLQCATVNQVVICSCFAMAVLISFWIKGLMAFN